jgi:predicted esterase
VDFQHQYLPPTSPESTSGLTVLALHGTGGDEHDLLGLARVVAPGAGIISPRGRVLENGMPRFFRRLAEGVFDEADLIAQAASLANFVGAAATVYGFDPTRIAALGFSNGANIASALLLLHPGVLRAAALLRPMVPLIPSRLPSLPATPVLVSAGRNDPIVPLSNTEGLVALLREAGADVELHWEPGGHTIGNREPSIIRQWWERTQPVVGVAASPPRGR